jgi:hypothetical protein
MSKIIDGRHTWSQWTTHIILGHLCAIHVKKQCPKYPYLLLVTAWNKVGVGYDDDDRSNRIFSPPFHPPWFVFRSNLDWKLRIGLTFELPGLYSQGQLRVEIESTYNFCKFTSGERENNRIWVYLSSIQHKNLPPCRFVAGSSQMIKVDYFGPSSNQINLKKPRVAYYFKAFMLDAWEIHSYTIIPSLHSHPIRPPTSVLCTNYPPRTTLTSQLAMAIQLGGIVSL